MYYDKMILKEGNKMEKVMKKYFAVGLFYLVIIGGILILNHRFALINAQNSSNFNYFIEK